MKSTIIGIIVSLIIGGGIGYYSAKGSAVDLDQTKKLEESVTMMKEQSVSIKQMAEMMKSGGVMMQERGAQYKDEDMMSKGKDFQMIGEKYTVENKKAEDGSGSMKQMMD